jgi:hypothetical protein
VDQSFNVTVENVIDAPTVTSTAVTAAAQDAAYGYTFAATDVDGDTLTYSAAVLPSWLSFDAASGVLSGTPSNAEVGDHGVTLRVNDGTVDVDQSFTVTVSNVNDAPVVTSTAVTAATQDAAYSYTFAATDIDGDALTYSAPVMPSWLSFDAATGVLSGTPSNAEVGDHGVTLRVNDGTVDVDQSFTVTVSNVNDTPTLARAIADQSVSEDAPFTFTVPADTFTDVDGDNLTLTAALSDGSELPAWLTFETGSGAFSGTPSNDEVGTVGIKVTAADNNGESVSGTFDLTVANVNDAPTISGIPYTTAVPDRAYNFVPAVSDDDAGDQFTFSIVNKPNWANFDVNTGALSGIPAAEQTDSITSDIVITVTDREGASASLPAFDLTVRENVAPTISGAPYTTAMPGESYSFEPTVGDGDAADTGPGRLSFSIVNQPSWANFNPLTGELTSTPSTTDVGVTSGIVITVTDSAGASASLPAFSLTVRTNEAPIISGTPDEALPWGENYSFSPAASDPDTDESLSFSIANKPDWASFNVANGFLTGEPTKDQVRIYPDIQITVTDSAGLSASLPAFAIAVKNHPPIITGTPLTTAVVDQEYSYQPLAFDDEDAGDSLTFSIENKPVWANFNEDTGALTGIPRTADIDTTAEIVITVKDSAGDSASLPSFDLLVIEVNHAPTIGGAPPTTVTPDQTYSFKPDAGDSDGEDTLVFSIQNRPEWAIFNTVTGILTGTPTEADFGTTEGIVITVIDSAGASASLPSFDLTVRTNEAPTVANALPDTDTFAWVGKAFTFKVPEDTFADGDLSVPEFNESLTLSASLADGSALPEWLDFKMSDREFWGTPFTDDFGTKDIKVTATDAAGETVSVTFTLHIARVAAVQGSAMEWGTIEVKEGEDVRIPLANGYVQPVVVARPLAVGDEWGLVRLNNVTSDSFDAVYDEPYGSGNRSIQVFYLVAEKGVRDLGGLTVQAGTLETGAMLPAWETVPFTQAFSEVPAVFTSLQTAHDAAPAMTRVQDCTTGGFEVVMQEPGSGGSHGTENIGWIAIEKGLGRTSDGRSVLVFDATASNDSTHIDLADQYTDYFYSSAVSEKFARLFPLLTEALGNESYKQNFENHVPILMGDMTTTYETDAAVLHFKNLVAGSVDIFVQDVLAGEAGSAHALEDISIFIAE